MSPSDKGSDNGSENASGNWIDDARVAAAFLTRLPIPLDAAPAPGRLAEASWSFPLVGLVVGITGGLVYGVAVWLGLTPLLAAVFAVAGQIAMTGALHEDAAGDVADGFGGGATRRQKLEIMRDSRVGSYGAVALVLVIGARVAALAALADAEIVIAALVAAGAASRASMVAVMDTLSPARDDGLAASAGRPEHRNVIVATAFAVVIGLLALGLYAGIVGLVGAAAGAGGLAWIAQRQIGGHTGDVLGACQQSAEVLCLAAIVAMAS
jgi:adenosylcobinamide-GDP ribazoletransferase